MSNRFSHGTARSNTRGDARGNSDTRSDTRGNFRNDTRGANLGAPRSYNRDSLGAPRSDTRGKFRSDTRVDSRDAPRSDARVNFRGDNRGDSQGAPRSDTRGNFRNDNRNENRGGSRAAPRNDTRGNFRNDSRGDTRSETRPSFQGNFSSMSLFVTCAPGIEPLLIEELMKMGYTHCRAGFCGVYVDNANTDTVLRINYCSRLAGRVLLPLVRFRCYDKESLYKAVGTIDWKRYFRRAKTFAIDANVTHPALRNSLFAAQIAKDAICDQLREATGNRPNIELKEPDLQLNLYIHGQEGVMSLDTSGQSLHKRGYRQEAGDAPLQETLAAALLHLGNYTADDVMIDPCCGSGTLLIEAALMASNTAPGYLRTKWGFMCIPEFTQEDWLRVKNEADEKRVPLEKGKFFGCEINSTVHRICKINLKAAGFLDRMEITHTDFADFTPPTAPTFMMTNPPHGIRMVDVAPLCPMYRRLGEFMKEKLAKPARAFVFVGDLDLAKEVGLAAKRRHVLQNGGIDSRLLEFDIF